MSYSGAAALLQVPEQHFLVRQLTSKEVQGTAHRHVNPALARSVDKLKIVLHSINANFKPLQTLASAFLLQLLVRKADYQHVAAHKVDCLIIFCICPGMQAGEEDVQLLPSLPAEKAR